MSQKVKANQLVVGDYFRWGFPGYEYTGICVNQCAVKGAMEFKVLSPVWAADISKTHALGWDTEVTVNWHLTRDRDAERKPEPTTTDLFLGV